MTKKVKIRCYFMEYRGEVSDCFKKSNSNKSAVSSDFHHLEIKKLSTFVKATCGKV